MHDVGHVCSRLSAHWQAWLVRHARRSARGARRRTRPAARLNGRLRNPKPDPTLRQQARRAQGFIREFFDQNPLSHLGLIVMRNGVAERLTDLSGSPVRFVWAMCVY